MSWTNLESINLSALGGYGPLPMGEAGGEINIRIPAFEAGETGAYLVGIYSGNPEDPSLISQQQVLIAPYSRHLFFTIPANVSGLVVGLQLVSHDNLAEASYSVVVQWQLVNQINQFPGNFSLPLALTLEQVTGLIGANLSANYPSYSDLSALEMGVGQLIQSLIPTPPVYSGQSPPENPNEGDLWWELDENGARIRPWPWQRFGIYWASSEVQYLSRRARDLNGNSTLVMDDAVAWAGETGRMITSINWSFLRHFSNTNESTWRIQFLVRTSNHQNNVVTDFNPIEGSLSPDIATVYKVSPNFGWVGHARLVALNVFRLSGTGQMDLEVNAAVRVWRV